MPLYRRILGESWNDLPPPIREMHDVDRSMCAEGLARVTRGKGLLSRIVGAMVGFPKESSETPVHVEFSVKNGIESWTRTFGDDRFRSDQFAGHGKFDRLLCERFGPLTFAMALVLEGNHLQLVLRGWSFFGIPLPMLLCPRSASYESSDAGRFNFHVDISHPFTGFIVRYEGWLKP